MSVLGINMTDKEPVVGWESILPHARPQNRLWDLSIKAWEIASRMVDEHRGWDEIGNMQAVAIELETLARNEDDCTCTPLCDCHVCNAVARLMNNDDYVSEQHRQK